MRKLAGQLAWITSGKLVAAVLQALTLLLLARWLGPERFGLVVTALATIVVLQVLSDLGISTYVIRERAQNPTSPHIRGALTISDRLSLGLSLSLAIVAGGFFFAGVPEATPLVLLAVTAGADRNADCWLGVLLADGDARHNSVILTGRRAAIFVSLLALHAIGVDPVVAYCAGTAATSVAASILAHRVVGKRLSPGSALAARSLVARTKHYWLNSLYIQTRNVDVFLVTALAGASQAGFYSVASRVTGPIRMLPTSLATVLLASASRHQRDARGYRQGLKLGLVVLVVSWLFYGCLVATLPTLLPAVAGADYSAAVVPVQIVLVGLCFASAVSIVNALLAARSEQSSVARASGASTFICLVLVAALSSGLGAVGAGIALAVSYLANFIMVAAAGVRCSIFRSLDPTPGEQMRVNAGPATVGGP